MKTETKQLKRAKSLWLRARAGLVKTPLDRAFNEYSRLLVAERRKTTPSKRKTKRLKVVSVIALDNWHPNCPGNTVRVVYRPVDGRVAVWGDDDFGMEGSLSERDYLQLVSRPISIQRCKSFGLTQA